MDVVLVEGAVSSEEDVEKIQKIRQRSKVLVSLGDCAVTANVPSMRNRFSVAAVEHRAYIENAQLNQQIPREVIPRTVAEIAPGSRVREGGCLCAWVPAVRRYNSFCV